MVHNTSLIFIELTGYSRNHASVKLRSDPSVIRIKKTRVRKKNYDDDVITSLVKIWEIMDCICGQRLAPVMPDILERLDFFGEIVLEPDIRHKLLHISSSFEGPQEAPWPLFEI